MRKRMTRRIGLACVAGLMIVSVASGFTPGVDAARSAAGSVAPSMIIWCRTC